MYALVHSSTPSRPVRLLSGEMVSPYARTLVHRFMRMTGWTAHEVERRGFRVRYEPNASRMSPSLSAVLDALTPEALPPAPFQLGPGETVRDVARLLAGLRADLDGGPRQREAAHRRLRKLLDLAGSAPGAGPGAAASGGAADGTHDPPLAVSPAGAREPEPGPDSGRAI